jgi:hypothetical protein
VYPILLKSRLQEEGYFEVPSDVQVNIDIFESLCCAPTYGPIETETGETYVWNEIKGNAMFSQLFRGGGKLIEDDEDD